MRAAIVFLAFSVIAACGKIKVADNADGSTADGSTEPGRDASIADAEIGAGDPALTPVVSIGELRGMGDGPVDVILRDVYVTYAIHNQFYIQLAETGPAIMVYTGDAPPPVEVGNRIELHVFDLNTWEGNRQVVGFEVVANDHGAFNVIEIAQELHADEPIAPGPDLDAELVTVGSMEIVEVVSDVLYAVQYGDVRTIFFFRNAEIPADCIVGTHVRLKRGVVTQFGGEHQVRSDFAEDVKVLESPCP